MKVDTTKLKRSWLISDIHFGVRSSSLEWIEIHKHYFNEFFIPLINSNKKDGDCIIIAGDIFESRQSLNILVMNEAMGIIKQLTEIMPVLIIVGNHDIYRRNSNEVNSPMIFQWMDNIEIFSDHTILKFFGNKTALMLPWVEEQAELLSIIAENPADYLFLHSDITGIKYNKQILISQGLNPDSVSNFKRVYTGHIHYAQQTKNIRVLGCPFQLTRSDRGNTKSVWLFDMENNTEERFENEVSPKFLKINLESLFDKTLTEVKDKFNNNFVDIMINNKWSTKFPFGQLIDNLSGYRKINYIFTTDNGDETLLGTPDGKEINLEELILYHIDSLGYNENIKKKLKSKSLELYHKALMIQDNPDYEN